jgi:hypothetical protein
MANPWDSDPIYKPLAKASAPAANPWDNDPVVPPPNEQDGTLMKLAKGAAMGIADIGNTAINAGVGALTLGGNVLPSVAQWNRTRNADMDYITQQNKGSTAFQVGRVGANVVATLPVGGILGNGVKAVAAMPEAAALANTLGIDGLAAGGNALGNAIASGGFSTGAAPGVLNMITRAAGGAINGGASALLVNPSDAGKSAIIGAALPPALSAAGKVMGTAGRTVGAMVQPFTEKGQDAIAGKIIRKFADGGPIAIDASELVPGSVPTLAEATGNAGIATLQRGTRDLRPNAFVERESANAAARNGLFDQVAGDPGAIATAIDARDNAANALYGQAFAADSMRRNLAAGAQATKAPFAGVGLSAAPEDLATPGLRELASRPMFKQAVEDAKRLAANKGVSLDDPLQSLEGLHYIKLALDDALNPTAKTAMGRNASSAIMDMRDKLAGELAKVSPLYGNARQTFADMSQPINAMESLQGLKLTDARGNMTLAKVKNAIDSLEAKRAAPGVDPAKSITDDQLSALRAIHDDLLRQSNLGAGRSAGSNTFQNIATDNILSTLLPGSLGPAVTGKIGGVVGQMGKLAYSGPNEAIRNRLVEMMLQPQNAQNALFPPPAQLGRIGTGFNALVDSAAPVLYRAAPLLSSSR